MRKVIFVLLMVFMIPKAQKKIFVICNTMKIYEGDSFVVLSCLKIYLPRLTRWLSGKNTCFANLTA